MNEPAHASRRLDALIDAARAHKPRPISAAAEAAEFCAIEASVRTTLAGQRRRSTLIHFAGAALALAAALAVIVGAPQGSAPDAPSADPNADAVAAVAREDHGARDRQTGSTDVTVRHTPEDPAGAVARAITPRDAALSSERIDPQALVIAVADTWQSVSSPVDLQTVWPAVGGLSTIVAAYVFGGNTLVIETHVSTRAGAAANASADAVDEPERLARAAEVHMLAGRDPKARELLARIVTKHGKSRQARTALLDLARLERRSGAAARAACAYSAFLTKYPSDAMASEARRRLGELPVTACRGLRPAL